MVEGDYEGERLDLKPIPPEYAKDVNRVIYCHHCQTMDMRGMWLLGIAPRGGPVFECRRCSEAVHLR